MFLELNIFILKGIFQVPVFIVGSLLASLYRQKSGQLFLIPELLLCHNITSLRDYLLLGSSDIFWCLNIIPFPIASVETYPRLCVNIFPPCHIHFLFLLKIFQNFFNSQICSRKLTRYFGKPYSVKIYLHFSDLMYGKIRHL